MEAATGLCTARKTVNQNQFGMGNAEYSQKTHGSECCKHKGYNYWGELVMFASNVEKT